MERSIRANVVPHDHIWESLGREQVDQLHSTLGALALRIEHIGSTAIPGMAAKPVIDLQVSVLDLEEATLAFDPPLAREGFERFFAEHDHVPEGISDPTAWAKRTWWRRGLVAPDANLHVRIEGSPNERFALLFRDYLQAHTDLVPHYTRFKTILAERLQDVDDYTDVKDPVVDLIVAVAESWAAETGWVSRP
jgi:GrpB-like predicted nucleotidyltransferase (UPF0157 family)